MFFKLFNKYSIMVSIGILLGTLTPATTLPAKNTSSIVLQKPHSILVEKSKRLLHLLDEKKNPIKTYHVALGFTPQGAKTQEGDGKTPEGNYTICWKNSGSRFHCALKVSYPNATDRKNAQKRGVKPGGDIMIHGLGKEFAFLGEGHRLRDWTLGCIAVTNEEIEEIYQYVKVGTPIQIIP